MRMIIVLFTLLTIVGCGNGGNQSTPTPPTPTPPTPTQTISKKALLVGINKYPGAPLSGCINDINDMAAVLKTKYGFADKEINIMTDGDATTKNILDNLQWLLANTNKGDIRFFHYSGHGAEYAGPGSNNQPDNSYQVICPVDFDWSEDKMIKDVQFNSIFKQFQEGVIFNWVSDSCHSGDLTKAMPKKGIAFKKYPNTPPEISERIKKAKRAVVNGILDVGYVSGCKSDQTSADASINDRWNGALTFYFLETLNASPGASLKDLVKGTNERLKANTYDQEPQAEGTRVDKQFLSEK